MRRVKLLLLVVVALGAAAPALALNPGTDVLVPAASRGAGVAESTWMTDLYLFNPGSESVAVTLSWLVRNQANPNPTSESFTLLPGETLVLEDVVFSTFGLESGNGAFRVQADGEVVVNSRIYNLKGTVTFGQGFAGVPRSAAIASGDSTDVVGLTQNASFRTNIVLIDASGGGATVSLSLRDPSGTELASGSYTLGAFEPRLFAATALAASLTYDDATLHAEVTAGSAIVVASKVDNDAATGDPTTLEAWSPLAVGGSDDGTYQLAIYDSAGYATGGNLVIAGGQLTAFDATYSNWDKLDDQGEAACPYLFGFGGSFNPAYDLDALAQGVSWTQPYTDGGTMTWTLQLTLSNGMSWSGTVTAAGTDFPTDPDPYLDQSGCNGTFPPLTLLGGKS
jgi:hypothetical protein